MDDLSSAERLGCLFSLAAAAMAVPKSGLLGCLFSLAAAAMAVPKLGLLISTL
jgi:hypothetical protein